MALKTYPWTIDDHLKTPEDMIGYLEAAFEDGDPAGVALAIQDVARLRGVDVASASSHAEIGSLLKVMKALDLELTRKAA